MRWLRVALLAAWAATGCRRAISPAPTVDTQATNAATPPATPVAKSTDLTTGAPDDRFLGMIIAPETVDVTSQLEARLTEVRVRAGDHVARGDVLARLDTRSARHELAIAAAELATARSERDRARLELAEDQERLARRQAVVELPTQTVGTVSDEEVASSRYEQRKAAVKVAAAQAEVSSKAAHLAELRMLLAEGAVRAPFAGTVAARYADVGSLIHKGTPIVRLIESGELRVRFAIPEERANSVAVGDPVQIAAAGLTLSGVVEKLAPEIDAASRMIFAEASLDVPAAARERIRSGEAVRVRPTADAEHAEATVEAPHGGRAR